MYVSSPGSVIPYRLAFANSSLAIGFQSHSLLFWIDDSSISNTLLAFQKVLRTSFFFNTSILDPSDG
jgi:hypothetical protein